MNNTTSSPIKTNGTLIPGYNPFYRTKAAIIAQTISLAVLGAIIVFGNLAFIITFLKTKSLRRRSHYLIISLSVADLLVGVGNFMCGYFFWTGPQWNTFIVVLETMETLTGIASVLTLSNIAIERFYAIFYPFRHRRLRFRVYIALCVFPWIVATYISALYFTSFVYDQSVLEIHAYHTFSVAIIALLVILISYIAIGVKVRGKNNPSTRDQNRPSRDKKSAVTLLMLTLPFLLTWMPLQFFLILLYFCHSCNIPHFNVLFVLKFLQFCNPAINVFIYIVRMPEFRSAFLKLFCGKSEQNARVQEDFVGDQDGTGQNCLTRGMACPNNASKPLSSYNNSQKMKAGSLQGSFKVNKSNVENDGARANPNPTNQNARNWYSGSGSQDAKESESRNTSQPDVTREDDSSFDNIDISFGERRGEESGCKQGVTNHACETEASGTEDSRL